VRTELLFAAGCMSATLGCAATLPSSGPFSRLIVFGDSYSDTGNLNSEIGVPAAPYYSGRFTDGPVWIEGVADHLRLQVLPSYFGGTNYAHGGASSETGLESADGMAIGLNAQEQARLYSGHPDGSELFVVWCGSVDVLLMLKGTCHSTPDHVADNVGAIIQSLYDRGGRQFLVPNIPNLGLSPQFNSSDQAAAARDLCAAITDALSTRLDQLANLPNIHIYRLDAAGILANMATDPIAPITEISAPIWSGTVSGYSGGGVLEPNPEAFLYWDFNHPSHAWHAAVAETAIDLLAAQGPSTQTTPGTVEIQPPSALSYWTTYFSQLSQSDQGAMECRY